MTQSVPDLIADLRAGLEGVTPGPWKPIGIPYDGYDDPFVLGDGEVFVCQTVYDMQSTTTVHDVNADTRHIARCSPENIRILLDHIASLETSNEALRAALAAGKQLANVAYNVHQIGLGRIDAYHILSLKSAQEEWDRSLSQNGEG